MLLRHRRHNAADENLYQDIDWDLPLDPLQQGTPIVPNKPAVAVWLRHPGEQATGILATLDIDLMPYLLFTSHDEQAPGIAIVMGNRALTTFSPNLMPIDQLPKSKADNLTLPNLPLTIMFYNEKLTPNDIRLTLLGSPVLSLMIGVLCYYMLLLRQSPERTAARHQAQRVLYRIPAGVPHRQQQHRRAGSADPLAASDRGPHPARCLYPLRRKQRADRAAYPPAVQADRRRCAAACQSAATGR